MSTISDKIREYKRRQLQLTTHNGIICKLHERCVQLIKMSITEADEHKQERLNQAQNIIVQLERSLKIEDQISRSLYLLYDYCYCQIETGKAQAYRNALLIMSNLRDTFLHLAATPE